MTEAIPTLYTSRSEIESIFTINGVDFRLDDDYNETISATEETYLDAIIIESTDIVNQYLLPLYSATDLAESRWIRRRASYIACYFLSMRRGNPRQFGDRYDEILSELEAIAMGPGIPGNPIVPRVPLRKTFTPSYINPEIDDRFGPATGFGLHADPLVVHSEGPDFASDSDSETVFLSALLSSGTDPANVLVGRGV